MNEPQAIYDTPWKQALEQYFEPFLVFFFPTAHAVIDWNYIPESLDKELQQLMPDAEVGKRIADKLFKVWRQGGEEAWVLVHVEVQSQEESGFAERMYVYNYRCFDRYRKPVISLAVLGDEQASWRPSSYGYALGGCELSLRFPVAKLLDYDTQWQVLEESLNPFAIVVMAHLKTKATHNKPQERKQWKWSLVRRLFERGYSREDVVQLFRLIDWMMVLPQELQQEFKEELSRYQEENQMPLLSRIELDAKLETLREDVITILEVRFGEVTPELIEVINTLKEVPVLKQLHREAIAIPSIEEFQQVLELALNNEEHLAGES